MNKKEIMIFAVLLVVAFVIGFFAKNSGLTGNVTMTGGAIQEVEDNYSWTKAICNEGKCIDVLIECKNGNVVSLRPMSDLGDIGTTIAEVNNSQLCS
jgi:hypothetical protein